MSYRIEKTEIGTDIVISGWEEGIVDNPYEGIYDMRNCDAVTIPGEVSVAMSTQSMFTQTSIQNKIVSVADPINYVWTYLGDALEINTAIIFSNSGGALPTGISTYTPYYVKTVTLISPNNYTFTISTTAGGATKTFSGTGTGTHSFSTIQMGIPKFFTNSLYNNYYWLYFTIDSNGRVWVLDNSTLSNTNKWVYTHNQLSEQFLAGGNGLQAYKQYLFWFSPTNVSVLRTIDPTTLIPSLEYLTTGSNWVSNWKTILSSAQSDVSHYSLVGQDDILYFCNKNSIGSIGEISGSLIPTLYGNGFSLAEGSTVADGVTTNGSKNITTVSAFFASTDVGAVISGTGIPTGTIISSVTDNKTATLSANATANGSGITFTIVKSYTYNASALGLPSNDLANCLAELGTNLMVGGINNYIYPWDRVSTSFSFPIFLSENYVSRMVTINTTMYIFAGFRGRIFITNGSNATPFYKIADYLSNVTNPYIIWTDATFNRNQLYFGLRVTTNSGTTINEYGGLWAIDVDSVSPVAPRLENQMSYGTYSGYVNAIFVNRKNNIGTLPSNDGYGLFTGWYSGSVGGIDVGISTPYTGGQAYIDTDPIPIGQYLTNRTITGLEYKLGAPLATNESITLSYRTQLSGSYTDNPLDTYVTGSLSQWGTPKFEKSQWLQLRAILTSTASSPSYCRLREIRIHLK